MAHSHQYRHKFVLAKFETVLNISECIFEGRDQIIILMDKLQIRKIHLLYGNKAYRHINQLHLIVHFAHIF